MNVKAVQIENTFDIRFMSEVNLSLALPDK